MAAEVAAGKRYDRAYFDRLYRDPATRVNDRAEVKRKSAMMVGLAEYFLGRPIERVLDVGCGEGNWRTPLLKLRPRAHYLGIDSSEYVVQRFGRSRNIHLMDFASLAEQRFSAPFDLIVCANVLHYIKAADIRRGLSGFAELLDGMAFVETYTRSDQVEGDRDHFTARNPGWYRKAFAEVGLVACGPHAWLSADIADELSALERPA